MKPKPTDTAQGGVIVNSNNELAEKLATRRITPEVISKFKITPRGKGWQYPTPGGGLRWKNANSHPEDGNKYAWLDGKSDADGIYYSQDDLAFDIRVSKGVCWFTGGEADLWALHSAKILHSCASFGEKHVPKNLKQFLIDRDVSLVYIAPDLDETGEQWANKVATALDGSGIELSCRTLPKELGEKGDIGKAWQHYKGKIPFERYLLELPRWSPAPNINPALTLPDQTHDVKKKSESDFRLSDETRQAIFSKLGVMKFRSNHWSLNNVRCPFHKDETPSASVHDTKGIYCHAEGRFYNWKQTAEKLGIIPVWDVTPVHMTSGRYWEETTTPALKTFGLCIEAQQELIRLGLPSLSRVLTLLYMQGKQGGETITRQDLDQLHSHITPYTIRKAREQIILCGILTPLFLLQQKEEYKTLKEIPARKRGQPKKQEFFRLPTPAEINQALGVKPAIFQTIAPDKIQKAAKYKAEVYAAKPKQRPGKYARKQLMKPQGIKSHNTAQAYDKLAGLEVTPNIERSPEPLTQDDLQALPEKRDPNKGNYWLELEDGTKLEYSQRGAAYAVQRGGAIYRVIQQANTYKAGGNNTSEKGNDQ